MSRDQRFEEILTADLDQVGGGFMDRAKAAGRRWGEAAQASSDADYQAFGFDNSPVGGAAYGIGYGTGFAGSAVKQLFGY